MNTSIKNKIMIAVISAAIGVVGALGVSAVSAQTNTTTNGITSLVQKIATKFNLNQSDVQAVFDQDRQEKEAQHQADYQAKLSQLVTDGKITEAQKNLIVAKQKKLQANRETNKDSMRNLTEEQRHAKMEEERQTLEKWATDNNIDLQYLHFGMGKGRGGHRGGPFAPKMTPSTTSPTPAN